jgi:hypothetical protein
MIDNLLKPKGAFIWAVALILGGSLVTNFLVPLLTQATISTANPSSSYFIGVITSLVAWIAVLAFQIGFVLVGVAIILLKLERSPGADRAS